MGEDGAAGRVSVASRGPWFRAAVPQPDGKAGVSGRERRCVGARREETARRGEREALGGSGKPGGVQEVEVLSHS